MNSGQALKFWHSIMLSLIKNGEHDLTQRQMAILMTIYLEQPPHTVRGLAARLDVTKPVITRALDTMGEMKLVDRKRDDKDRRNVIITRTLQGALYLETLAEQISAVAKDVA